MGRMMNPWVVMPRQTVIRYLHKILDYHMLSLEAIGNILKEAGNTTGHQNNSRLHKEETQDHQRKTPWKLLLPGKLGQFSEDGLHVKNFAGDEEADSNRGKVDNPGCHLRRILHSNSLYRVVFLTKKLKYVKPT